jgi:hypothetical protein
MNPLDTRITDYLFWLKFAWSVWAELRGSRDASERLVAAVAESVTASLTEN